MHSCNNMHAYMQLTNDKIDCSTCIPGLGGSSGGPPQGPCGFVYQNGEEEPGGQDSCQPHKLHN